MALGNALLAAATAISTSLGEPEITWPTTSSVAGFTISIFSEPSGSTKFPPI